MGMKPDQKHKAPAKSVHYSHLLCSVQVTSKQSQNYRKEATVLKLSSPGNLTSFTHYHIIQILLKNHIAPLSLLLYGPQKILVLLWNLSDTSIVFFSLLIFCILYFHFSHSNFAFLLLLFKFYLF